MYKEDLTDTRVFQDIWASLTAKQKEDVHYGIIRNKCATTRQTVYNWSMGKSSPANAVVKTAVAKVVSKVTGRKCFGETLFPTR